MKFQQFQIGVKDSMKINKKTWFKQKDARDGEITFPAITVIHGDYYVMASGIGDGHIEYIDPGKGWIREPFGEFGKKLDSAGKRHNPRVIRIQITSELTITRCVC